MLNRIKDTLSQIPLFLILIPFYVVLHLETVFHHQINYWFALVQLAIMGLASIAFIIIGRLLTSKKENACIIALLLMMPWFYGGITKNVLEKKFPDLFFSSYLFLLPFVLILLCWIIYKLIKYNGTTKRLYLFINCLWIIFILLDTITIILQDAGRNRLVKKYAVDIAVPVISDSLKPDIYYIIFDSYSSDKILKEMGSDNQEIEDKLVANGFRVIAGSSSNYNLTPFSIGSTLNMKYLPEANTEKKYLLDEYLPATNIVKYNGLLPWLEKQGYVFNNFSFFDFDHHPATIPTHDIWDIEDIFLQQNTGLKIYKDLFWNFKLHSLNDAQKLQSAIDKRDRYDDSVYSLLLTSSTEKKSRPKFVYAHFFMPHIPNSRDSNGLPIPVNTNITVDEEIKGYCNEIRFVNKRIETISNSLVRNSKRPMVIILQGDHGYRFYNDEKEADEFPNFSAVYFSNKNYSQLTDTLSNVNLFKVVLNTWFKQNIPYDQTRHFFLHYK